MYQYTDASKCAFASAGVDKFLQRGLSTAWHPEVSLQIRDEGLFFSFPVGKLRIYPSLPQRSYEDKTSYLNLLKAGSAKSQVGGSGPEERGS